MSEKEITVSAAQALYDELWADCERAPHEEAMILARHIAAAEERGRRRGVEEAAKVCDEVVEHMRARHEYGDVIAGVQGCANQIRALAPRDVVLVDTRDKAGLTALAERIRNAKHCVHGVALDSACEKCNLAPRDSAPVCDCEASLWQGAHAVYCATMQPRDSGKEV